ncbi:MAG: 1-deoxy-D-xylulose-5-phosphate synthase [Thiohalomonadales bacterium]
MTHLNIPLRIESIQTPQQLHGRSAKELSQLSDEVREFLLRNISATGGHIGANLGTIELTIGLHAVFNSPGEPIIWDTGHQGYTHKLLTGRANLFPSLNRYNGMNRFVTRSESDHDLIDASHAGTSISIASGIAMARRINDDKRQVVAVIGDSALAEGMALEALNHLAVEDVELTLVINDNGYAISPGFGGLHEAMQSEGRARTLFESWGLNYHGPIDGHNIKALLDVFSHVYAKKGVNLVHVKTIKGNAWPPADAHPLRMHFSFPFDRASGAPVVTPPGPAYQDIAAAVVLEQMEHDDKIVCITPSTLYATGLTPAFEKYPERCFDPGMEEQHAMTMSVGFALEGMKPVVAYQSTFLQRAFDQLFHDVCFMNLPILILSYRSGFAGYDNPTHHGVYDFSYLRVLPNLKILYPKDRHETERMVGDELRDLSGPLLILMPYGPVDDIDKTVLQEDRESFSTLQTVIHGSTITLITVGHKFVAARGAVERLRADGVDAGLVNLRYLKPLPEQALLELMSNTDRIVTVEEFVRDGGVGSAIVELAADNEVMKPVLRIALPSVFIEPGSNHELEKIYGLDADGIYQRIKQKWETL